MTKFKKIMIGLILTLMFLIVTLVQARTFTSGLPSVSSPVSPAGTIQSFNDNGNSTITDNITGLMWQQTNGSGLNYNGAVSYCTNLILGGHNDWRLPTRKEIYSVVNFNNSVTLFSNVYFPLSTGAYYWTSTPYYGGGANHVILNITRANPDTSSTATIDYVELSVRCVR